MGIEIRPVSKEEIEAFHHVLSVPFGFDPTPEMTERFRSTVELDRLRAAFDGDQMVATFGAFSFLLTVPGGTVSTAGTTVVTVLPTHRRQGILRSMMTEHLREVHQNNEPLAALWASESSIYGRYGYGQASERFVIRLEKPFAKMQQPVDIHGAMQLLEKSEALECFPDIYNLIASKRPGMFERSKHWWEHRVLIDPEERRNGATAHRRVLYKRDGNPVGYAVYRTCTNISEGKTEVRVVELIGVDSQAEKSLWQYIFGIDLVDTIKYWNQPVDDSLSWWLEQPREVERKIEDALWVRLVDVASALADRRYSCSGCLIFQLSDDLCPWNDGVYRLEVDHDGVASCQLTTAEAEINLSPYALGAAYLGGHRFQSLARAGLIEGSVESLKRADSLFTWDSKPWCQEVF